MDELLRSKDLEQIANASKERIEGVIMDGCKNSTVFCLGEEKQSIVTNLKVFIDSALAVLSQNNHRINTQAFEHVLRDYNLRYAERIGNDDSKNQNNHPPMFDVVKISFGSSMDGIPAVFIMHYPMGNLNISDCGRYEQPEYSVRIPLIYGSESIYVPKTKNKSPLVTFGISRDNLHAARSNFRQRNNPHCKINVRTKFKQISEEHLLGTGTNNHAKQHNAKQGRNNAIYDADASDGVIPRNATHETTIVDAIAARTSTARLLRSGR